MIEENNDDSPAVENGVIETASPLEEPPEDEGGYSLVLPTFHGPLDLLLHLIRKHEIDIYDIPIALVTEQYNRYLEAMEELNLEIAADYIYMAALLIHIKSRMLLPRREDDEPDEDPRQELVDRLLEYQRFKSVAETFAETDLLRIGVWPRPRQPVPGADPSEVDLSEVSLFDLIDAFQTALRRYRSAHPKAMELIHTVHRVSDKMRDLMAAVAEKSPMRLLWYLEGRSRGELVAIFLGILELMRLGGIRLKQGGSFAEITVLRTGKEIDPEAFAVFDAS